MMVNGGSTQGSDDNREIMANGHAGSDHSSEDGTQQHCQETTLHAQQAVVDEQTCISAGEHGGTSGEAHCPECPDCHNAMTWSDDDEGGSDWVCENFDKCEGCWQNCGKWRWLCRSCDTAFCSNC